MIFWRRTDRIAAANAARTGGTWTLARPLAAGRRLLTLADTLTDAAGNRVVAAAATAAGVPPAPPFQYRFNVLPGDGDGRIDTLDYGVVRSAVLTVLPPAQPTLQALPPLRSAYRPVRAAVLNDGADQRG